MGATYVSAAVLTLPNNPFRKFNSIGFSITCSADKLITDSAAGATAISAGHRTNNHHVGIDTLGNPVKTLFEEAEDLDMATGIVVTSTVTHATPASFVAHVKSRSEETEISNQFLKSDIDVVIGGGAKYFNPVENYSSANGFDLLKNRGYTIHRNWEELSSSNPKDKFYALIEDDHLKRADEREYSLADLTDKALTLLSQNENGFVLMIEGSQIDWGGHDNNQQYVISELNDFCGAINTSLEFAEKNQNTLVLVTADHETGGMYISDGTPNGSEITLKFASKGHSAAMVGVFAKGPGEELFRGVFDNFIIGQKLFQLLNPNYHF